MLDNKALALFGLTMAATTNFLNQLALAPLYGLIATQKTFICSTNSLMAAATGLSVTIGDASIQDASGIAAGKCMSQYFTSNAQEPNSPMSIGAISTAMKIIGLDALLHPIDATLTWMQGCVSGLQDIVETVNRAR